MILFYVSGHGLGHFSREIEVINFIRNIKPDLPIVVKTPAAGWFVQSILPKNVEYEKSVIDIGVLQSDSLTVKPLDTLKAYSELIGDKEFIISTEAEWCFKHQVQLIIADIPPFAFDIADRTGIPSIAICNFSWDWIYAEYVAEFPQFNYILDDIRQSESLCTLCLSTPLKGDLAAFPKQESIPLIGRKSHLSVEETRKRLGISETTNIILFSFGGFGINSAELMKPDLNDNTIVLTTQTENYSGNWIVVTQDEMKKKGLKYEDLVNTADAVLSKPGYGIVSECIANNTGIIHLPRSKFIEAGVMVNEMKKYIPEAMIPMDDFYSGNWRKYFNLLKEDNRILLSTAVDGAEKAAERIISFL